MRRDEPVQALSALMASMGPIYGINSALTIATTIGTSADTLASDRLLHKISQWWSLDLDWDRSRKFTD